MEQEKKQKIAIGGYKNFTKDLLEFFKEYSVIGLAIGVIVAQTSKDLIDSIVRGLFTPFVDLIVPVKDFPNLTFNIAGSLFNIGSIISSLMTFIIVMVILYVIIKKILKDDNLIKK